MKSILKRLKIGILLIYVRQRDSRKRNALSIRVIRRQWYRREKAKLTNFHLLSISITRATIILSRFPQICKYTSASYSHRKYEMIFFKDYFTPSKWINNEKNNFLFWFVFSTCIKVFYNGFQLVCRRTVTILHLYSYYILGTFVTIFSSSFS